MTATKQIIAIIFMLLAIPCMAQQKNKQPAKSVHSTKKAATTVFKKPSYPGGQEALDKYLSTQLRYPENALEAGVQGRVVVRFMVDEKGTVTNPKVVRGIGAGCDEEARRVVSAMPKWIPATYGNKPAKMMYVLPITFKLE